MYLVRI